jgi:hypothetical protein
MPIFENNYKNVVVVAGVRDSDNLQQDFAPANFPNAL